MKPVYQNLFLALLLIVFGSLNAAFARGGGGCDGGGTGIFDPKFQHLRLWDLYSNADFNFVSVQPGEKVSALTEIVEKFNYSQTGAFQLLKNQVGELALYYHELFTFLNYQDFILYGDRLNVQLVPFFPLSISELYKSDFYLKPGYEAHPVAIYDSENGYIFVNFQKWNALDLQSQAALLLHERLRVLQDKLGFSNEILQTLVAFTMADRKLRFNNLDPIAFANLSDEEKAKMLTYFPNESYFRILNARLKSETPIVSPAPTQLPAAKVQELLKNGILGGQGIVFLNPATTGFKNGVPTAFRGDLFGANNCNHLISGFESVRNSQQTKLRCDRQNQTAVGKGLLYFRTPITQNKLVFQNQVLIPRVSQGVSSYEKSFYDEKWTQVGFIRFENFNGVFVTNLDQSAEMIEDQKNEITAKVLQGFLNLKIEFDLTTNQVLVLFVRSDGAEFKLGTLQIGSLNLGASFNQLQWSFHIDNQARVKRITLN